MDKHSGSIAILMGVLLAFVAVMFALSPHTVYGEFDKIAHGIIFIVPHH